jgi:hypothetical protein
MLDKEFFIKSNLLVNSGSNRILKNSSVKQKEMEFFFIPEDVRKTRMQEKKDLKFCGINYNPKETCDCRVF